MAVDPEVSRSSVPPPPPSDIQGMLAEVSLRTMASDLAMMGRSGGGPPIPERITIPLGGGIAAQKGISGILERISKKSGFLAWVFADAAAIGFFFLIGYFVIPFFLSFREEEAPVSGPPHIVVPTPAEETLPVFLGHRTLLRVAADERIVIKLGPVSAAALRSFRQELEGALLDTNSASTFFEVEAVGPERRHLTWQEMLSLLGVSFPQEVWEAFLSDFTEFVFRDEDGIWPGYLLELKGGKTALLVQSDIARIESASSSLAAFFLVPGGEIKEAFTDAQVAGQPIRIATFKAQGAAFVYGWAFNKFLVLSTSLEGFRQALLHL